jgi:hypothetical protein
MTTTLSGGHAMERPASLSVARVLSPDVCDGPRARRCTRRKPRFAVRASLGFLRRLQDPGDPERRP